jgi:sporulation protein YlmC with PRC-barrel domain
MYTKRASRIVLPALCILAMAGAASGQQQGQQGQQSQPREAPVAGTIPLGVAVAKAELVAKGWRATRLLGEPVYNDRNEKIGEIEDFVISPDGKVSLAILEVGGFLDLGEHRVAIPVEQFKQVYPRLVLPGADKNALKKLPEFHYA